QHAEDVFWIAVGANGQPEWRPRIRVRVENSPIRLAGYRNDSRNGADKLALCFCRSVLGDALLLSHRFVLQAIQHGVEAGDETPDLTTGTSPRPQIVISAVADTLRHGREFSNRTRDLPCDDQGEA